MIDKEGEKERQTAMINREGEKKRSVGVTMAHTFL
jgi:hypothetical protein